MSDQYDHVIVVESSPDHVGLAHDLAGRLSRNLVALDALSTARAPAVAFVAGELFAPGPEWNELRRRAQVLRFVDARGASASARDFGAVVETTDRTREEILDAALAALTRTVIVPLGERSYEVAIGPGARSRLSSMLPSRARRAAIVTQEGIDAELSIPIPSERFLIDGTESAKSLSTVERLCRGFSDAGLTRNDVVIGVGGGVVTDVAGFTAACYLRGVAVVHVSTTLLGQIDAAIGGKTGVNLPEGKNLVGAFWQPSAVICDTNDLASLPERELRSGHGEMAKYAFLGVEDLDELPLVEQITRCVALKAAVVGADEREGDARAILNYGHTLAHALEAAGFADGPGRAGIDLRHGEAVAIGLVFAAELAHLLGRIDAARVDRHRSLVRSYELPSVVPSGVDHEELMALMARDKKATDGLTFVLDGARGVENVVGVPAEHVREALRRSSQAEPSDLSAKGASR